TAVVSQIDESPSLVIWDTATGKQRPGPRLPFGLPHGVAWSPDGRRLAAWDHQDCRVWDAAGGRELLKLAGPDDPVRRVVPSPDGRRLPGLDAGHRSIALRAAATAHAHQTFKVPDPIISDVAFTADGARLVTVSRSGTVRSWDATASDLPVELPEPEGAILLHDPDQYGNVINSASS